MGNALCFFKEWPTVTFVTSAHFFFAHLCVEENWRLFYPFSSCIFVSKICIQMKVLFSCKSSRKLFFYSGHKNAHFTMIPQSICSWIQLFLKPTENGLTLCKLYWTDKKGLKIVGNHHEWNFSLKKLDFPICSRTFIHKIQKITDFPS